MNNLKNRIGTFSISRRLVEFEPETVQLMLHGCIVVRAECMWESNNIEYTALHESFDEVEEGMMAYKYMAVVEQIEIRPQEEDGLPTHYTIFKKWVRYNV